MKSLEKLQIKHKEMTNHKDRKGMGATVPLKQLPKGDVLLVAHHFNMNINVYFEKHKKTKTKTNQKELKMTDFYPYLLE